VGVALEVFRYGLFFGLLLDQLEIIGSRKSFEIKRKYRATLQVYHKNMDH
jgi:hypothetical protein